MTENLTPADLARFVHPVPVGATIPGGTEWVNRTGPKTFHGPFMRRNDFQTSPSPPRWTAEPIESPKPLPGWGTLVRVIGGEFDGKRAVALERDAALCPWFSEDYGWTPATDITDWEIIHDPTDAADAPAADPLDENDHRDRFDRDGLRITRHGNKHWHTEMATCYGHCRDNALADWNAACGPLRFADEVTA